MIAYACARKSIFLVVLFVLMATAPWAASAHEVRPAIAELSFGKALEYRISISLNLEALISQIGADHEDTSQSPNADKYNGLRNLEPKQLRKAFDGFARQFLKGVMLTGSDGRLQPDIKSVSIPQIGDRDLARLSVIVLGGVVPTGTKTLTWAWDKTFGANVIRVRGRKKSLTGRAGISYSAYLQNGAPSAPIPVSGVSQQDSMDVFVNYITVGYSHILPKGLDHILFVVGLFLLSTSLGVLAWQITSFTVAHTLTLGLGIYGIVNVSPAIVEPLIAASIVYVCIENILTDRLQRWRPVIVFGFGLLHGLGFAGVLAEIGLTQSHFLAGLIAFNIGVELGQLSVIALCFLVVGLWFRHKAWYRRLITIPASFVIALIGAWWFVERLGVLAL